MTKQIIDLGTPPGGIDGDTVYTAFSKSKSNFDELYDSVGGLNTAIDGFSNVDNTADADKPVSTAQAAALDALIPPSYIDGLKMVWVSGTALTVASGAAYIPSLSKVLRASSDIAKTGLSLTASTWYHVYLYDNSGTPDVEIVTTAPAAAYNGTARTKTGDTSRRYVGSVRTDASGAIISFLHTLGSNDIKYQRTINYDSLHVLVNGQATVSTNVSLSTALPSTARVASAFVENGSTGGTGYISNSDTGPAGGSNILAYIRASQTFTAPVITNSSQQILYSVQGTATPKGIDIWVTGYNYER